MKCKTLVIMTVDRIVKGKREVICMRCFSKKEEQEKEQTVQLTFDDLVGPDVHAERIKKYQDPK